MISVPDDLDVGDFSVTRQYVVISLVSNQTSRMVFSDSDEAEEWFKVASYPCKLVVETVCVVQKVCGTKEWP